MHLIFVQDTLTLLEVVEVVFMLRGEAEGAATEQTIAIIEAGYVFNFICMIIPAAFVVNSSVGVRVAFPLGNVHKRNGYIVSTEFL